MTQEHSDADIRNSMCGEVIIRVLDGVLVAIISHDVGFHLGDPVLTADQKYRATLNLLMDAVELARHAEVAPDDEPELGEHDHDGDIGDIVSDPPPAFDWAARYVEQHLDN